MSKDKIDINNLANQIILAKYPLWKQINLIDAKGTKEYEEFIKFRNLVIDTSNSDISFDEFKAKYFAIIKITK